MGWLTVAGLCTAAAPAWPAAAPRCAMGTFWQPLLAELGRSATAWQRWMGDLVDLGARRLIIQHCVLEPYDVLVPRAAGPPDPAAPDLGGLALRRVLDAARRHQVRVSLGLSYDPMFLQRAGDADGAVVQQYLRQRSDRALRLAQALGAAIGHPAVDGWYLSDEIDDLSWASPERAEWLGRWLDGLTRGLRRIAPQARVALSGFVNAAHTTPEQLAAQWRGHLAASPGIDEVLFQDGVGAGKVALADSDRYLGAMAAVTQAAGRRFTPVLELFEPDPRAPADSFRPAPLQRVQAQIEMARRHAPQWVAFSLPDYVTPDTPAARALRAPLRARCGAAIVPRHPG